MWVSIKMITIIQCNCRNLDMIGFAQIESYNEIVETQIMCQIFKIVIFLSQVHNDLNIYLQSYVNSGSLVTVPIPELKRQIHAQHYNYKWATLPFTWPRQILALIINDHQNMSSILFVSLKWVLHLEVKVLFTLANMQCSKLQVYYQKSMLSARTDPWQLSTQITNSS